MKTIVNMLMVLVYVLLNSFGAIAIKDGIERTKEKISPDSLKLIIAFFINLFKLPSTILGFTAIGLSAFVWITALSRMNLIVAYPIAISLNLLIVLIFALKRYNEHPTPFQIIGILFFFLGVIFISMEGKLAPK